MWLSLSVYLLTYSRTSELRTLGNGGVRKFEVFVTLKLSDFVVFPILYYSNM